MTSGVIITLIIVGGVVLICLAGIAWLWSTTARGGFEAFGGEDKQRLDSVEREVRSLRFELDRLREHTP